jgi:hypothetical protein
MACSINDEYILKRLYAILFSRLRKIQSKLTYAFRVDNPSNYSVHVTATMAQLWFVLGPSHMKYLRDTAKEYDAVNKVEVLFDVVWKVSRPFFRYSMWAHPPPSEMQKDNNKLKDNNIPYKDISGEKLHEINPELFKSSPILLLIYLAACFEFIDHLTFFFKAYSGRKSESEVMAE